MNNNWHHVYNESKWYINTAEYTDEEFNNTVLAWMYLPDVPTTVTKRRIDGE